MRQKENFSKYVKRTRINENQCRNFSTAKKSLPLLVLLFLLMSNSSVHAQGRDRIRTVNGTENGRVAKTTPLAITVSSGGVEKQIAVEDVIYIDFSGAPEELRSARLAAEGDRFKDAIESLKEIERGEIEREAVLQEIDYWNMYSNVKLALAGQGTLERAEQMADDFCKKNRSSMHLTSGFELFGDVLLAGKKFAEARAQYELLGRAKTPYLITRSALLTGLVSQLEGNHEAAIKQFDVAIKSAKRSKAAEALRAEASLQRAVSRSATGNTAEATAAVKAIIKAADPRNSNLMAQAYNALGDCYLKGDNVKAACHAFLHVDVLFSSESTEHAKALYELSQIWNKLRQTTRASDARSRLKRDYPGSRWARM